MKKHEAEQGSGPAGPAQGPPEAPAPARSQAAARPTPRAEAPRPRGQTPQSLIETFSANGYAPTLVAHHDRGGRIAEEYRSLRTNLLAQYEDERLCLLVTSAEPGEGKTVTCLNLALVLAELQERRVVVVDADLRQGRVARLLRIKTGRGLADVLRGKSAVAEVTLPTHYPNLSVVPAGGAGRGEIGELLGRPELEEALGRLRQAHDFVLLDTPPVNRAADTGIVGRAVKDALVVVRMNKTARDSVDRAIRLLHAANIKPVGLVLTHQRYYIPGYLYRYS
jgi:capsular exopolysaccharide synthesis family protein